ncbi:MAG: hydrogenobyrinic acid a,c-diamide synthase (glutamine-hydrolyzing), partial [Candidatus Methanomethylophilaceae archaeon]|nr:hydrogenobyrinic acid a,c-diamide synthase (glutamine-hydrolyzing) [Candidatus Methanomethylophilaceae archaeon]
MVLVLDAGSLTRSAAAIVNGFRSFDPEIKIEGVILNKVSGPQHSGKLDVAMETYCKGIRVLGKIRRDREMEIGQRHLGLSTSEAFNKETVEKLDIAGDMIDADGLLDIAENCEV